MNKPKVSIILINFNNFKDTAACIDSINNITYPNYEIITIDNGSGDDSYDKLLANYPKQVFIQNKKNIGFAAANNVGIRYALRHGADYCLILNNDTIVKKDFLEPMVRFLEQNNKAGLTGGKIYFFSKPKTIWTIGGRVSLLRGGSVYYGGGEKDVGQFNKVKEVGHISGCMCLIKRKVLQDVGFFSEQYFLRGEEWDFCYRVSRKGYKMFYIPDSVIWHKVSRTINRFSPEDIYNAYRAKIIFAKKFLPWPLLPFWLSCFYVYAIFVAPIKFYFFAKSKFGKKTRIENHLKAIFFALKEGLSKNYVNLEDIKNFKKNINS